MTLTPLLARLVLTRLRLLFASGDARDAGILALRHQVLVLQRQINGRELNELAEHVAPEPVAVDERKLKIPGESRRERGLPRRPWTCSHWGPMVNPSSSSWAASPPSCRDGPTDLRSPSRGRDGEVVPGAALAHRSRPRSRGRVRSCDSVGGWRRWRPLTRLLALRGRAVPEVAEGGWPPAISLDGMYPGGILREGREVQRSGDVVVCEPHRVVLSELKAHLGGTAERLRLLEHLTGFHDMFGHAVRNDPRAELWVRGNLVSTLSMQTDELDLVAIYGGTLSPGHGWLLGQLLASRVALPPYSLVVTPLRHDGSEHVFDRAREARRSRVRARDQDNDVIEAGWLSVTLGEGEAG